MKDNKLIAEFMGYPKIANDEDKRDYLEDCVKYDTSWDWLMPVIKKCKSLDNTFDVEYEVVNEDYHAVVEFIKQLKQ